MPSTISRSGAASAMWCSSTSPSPRAASACPVGQRRVARQGARRDRPASGARPIAASAATSSSAALRRRDSSVSRSLCLGHRHQHHQRPRPAAPRGATRGCGAAGVEARLGQPPVAERRRGPAASPRGRRRSAGARARRAGRRGRGRARGAAAPARLRVGQPAARLVVDRRSRPRPRATSPARRRCSRRAWGWGVVGMRWARS